ncbi:hypothetical protein [Pseudomonas rhizoryzae]|nr:hypothetical protein [Pseudomonas rhizoryzae]
MAELGQKPMITLEKRKTGLTPAKTSLRQKTNCTNGYWKNQMKE